MTPIHRVVIVGGTHGNELTGIYLVRKFEQHPDLIARSSFETKTLFANPEAFAIRRRYVDTDLNRCFQPQDLANLQLVRYEERRAKVIAQQLAAPHPTSPTLIIDLHSTTSNMGVTVIPSSHHPFNFQLAAYLNQVNPDVRVYQWSQAEQNSPFLRSLSNFGCAIEVGPVAQGVLDATLFQQAEALIYAILDYVDAYNRDIALPLVNTLTLYQCIQVLDYPKNDAGELQAMIHPQRQARDYQVMQPGDPLFLTFEGHTIVYEGNTRVYPVFINEAAYYEKGIAMCLTEQHQRVYPFSTDD